MDKNEILGPILTAINDLREEVRENRREIKKNREKIDRNSKLIQQNSEKIDRNSKLIQQNSEKIDRNSKLIQQNSEMIDRNSQKIDENSKSIISLKERMISIEKRMERHEEESRKDRKAILDILYSYEQVTNSQYEENKNRIEKLEEKFAIINVG